MSLNYYFSNPHSNQRSYRYTSTTLLRQPLRTRKETYFRKDPVREGSPPFYWWSSRSKYEMVIKPCRYSPPLDSKGLSKSFSRFWLKVTGSLTTCGWDPRSSTSVETGLMWISLHPFIQGIFLYWRHWFGLFMNSLLTMIHFLWNIWYLDLRP